MRPPPHDLASLTPLDWLLVLVLVWSVVLAFVRGLLRELAALAGLVVGLLVATRYYPPFAGWLGAWISSPMAADAVAFFLLLAGVGLLAAVLGRVLRRSASAIGLGLPDRVAGAAFGAIRGALLGLLIVLTAQSLSPRLPAVRDSRIAPGLLSAIHRVSFLVPQALQSRIVSQAHPARLDQTEPPERQ